MTVCKTEINSGHPVVWECSTLGWGLQHHVVSAQVRTEGCPLEGSPSTCAPSVTPTRSVCPSMPGMRRTWAGVTWVRPQPRLWDAPGTIKNRRDSGGAERIALSREGIAHTQSCPVMEKKADAWTSGCARARRRTREERFFSPLSRGAASPNSQPGSRVWRPDWCSGKALRDRPSSGQSPDQKTSSPPAEPAPLQDFFPSFL